VALILDSGFEIIYCSGGFYEYTTVEILYKRQQVTQINRDRGDDLLEAEIYHQYIFENMKIDLQFPLDDFLHAIEKAKEMLVEGRSVLSEQNYYPGIKADD
jgi:hypothetical protein